MFWTGIDATSSRLHLQRRRRGELMTNNCRAAGDTSGIPERAPNDARFALRRLAAGAGLEADYSALSACIGSNREARHAGIMQAKVATISSVRVTTA